MTENQNYNQYEYNNPTTVLEPPFTADSATNSAESSYELDNKTQNKPNKSSGLKVLVIILILVLLAGNATTMYLLLIKDSGPSLTDIKVDQDKLDDMNNQMNLFDTAGLLSIKIGDKYGYIDKTGKIIINPQFDRTGNFLDGVAIVSVNEKYGVIDTKGKYIVTPIYDEIEEYSYGLAMVRKDKKYGFIDKAGKIVIPIIYYDAYGMGMDGYTSVLTESKQRAIIDSEGKIIYSYDYSDSVCKQKGCYAYVYDSEYCYEHEQEECKWDGCDEEGTYGSGYCFDHYYALDE